MTHRRAAAIVAVLAGLFSGCAADPAAKLAAVRSGQLRQARASWWTFDPEDATACLQNAIDSGVSKLTVDNVGTDWVVGPIEVPSNIEIVFADGVVLRAKKGAFQGKSDVLLNITGRSNVIVRGEGTVRCVMNKADYQDPSLYSRAEHRHTVRIYNSQNVRVKNLALESSGGDGVYVGSGGTNAGAENVILEDLDCLNHHRQGISVTGAKNLLMKNCRFNNTSGTAPQCGIDYEPNYARFSVVNCVAENCEFNGNALAGACLSLGQLDATSEPVSIRFENCRILGNQMGVLVTSLGAGTAAGTGRIEFVGCRIGDNPGASFSLGDYRASNMAFTVKDCLIDNRRSETEGLRISSGGTEHLSGIRIEGLTVLDDATNRPPIRFISRFSNGLLNPAVSNVIARTSAGVETAFDTAAFIKASEPLPPDRAFRTIPLDLGKLKPLTGQAATAGQDIRFRQKHEVLQWAKAGQKINLTFTNRPVHRYEGKAYRDPLKVVVWCPSRAIVAQFGIPFEGGTNFALEAGETGIYRFEVDARMQTAGFLTDAPGQGVSAAETLYVFGCSGRLYFHVPAGVTNIVIEAGGSPHEASSAALLNAEGKEVDSSTNMEGSRLLRGTRPDAAKAEVWSIRFSAAKLFLRIGAPLVPVFSADPAALLMAE